METANAGGIGPDPSQPSPQCLSAAIVQAVSEIISHATGKSFPPLITLIKREVEPEIKADPAQLALAVAYANLCVEEPEMVTSSHLKMLRSNFSFEQIQELNQLIRGMLK